MVTSLQDTAGIAGRPVIVPLDGSDLSERALPVARAFLPAGAELVLVRVVPASSALAEIAVRDVLSAEEIDQAIQDEARQESEETLQKLAAQGAKARLVVADGDPETEIVRVAHEAGASLIVMATHGRGALGRFTYGSVTDRVARTAKVPVLVVRADERLDVNAAGLAAVRRLLVPYDGSEIAAQAIPVAAAYAAQLGAEVHLLRSVNPVNQASASFSFPASVTGDVSLYETLLDQDRADAETSLRDAAGQFKAAGVPVTTQVEIGPAAHDIADAAKPGDVIVMTSHGRSGFGRWLLGSVAEKLVREAPVPVLLVPAAERVATEARA